jgi:hypothetical protein
MTNYGWPHVGVYMRTTDHREVKRLLPLQPIADAELAQSKFPKFAYTVTVSPTAGFYFGRIFDYFIGDVVSLNASKGALSVSNVKQRIYQATVSISDNNVETVEPLISKDFYGKVV